MKNIIKKVKNKILMSKINKIFEIFNTIVCIISFIYFFGFIFLVLFKNSSHVQINNLLEFFFSLLFIFLLFFSFLKLSSYFDKKNNINISNLLKNLDLSNLNVNINKKIIKLYIENNTIDTILNNKDNITKHYGNKNWIYILFDTDDFSILNNSELIHYISDVDLEYKFYHMQHMIRKINQNNLNDFYDSIEIIFKDYEHTLLNSIKYKSNTLKQEKLKKESLIINI